MARTAALAFPTAKGAGAYTTGGSGGQVIHVTTLNWDGPGSLKEAIQTPGPRTVVFDVSGEIDATQEGAYTNIIQGSQYDNITIAGQTAPAGGITIRTSEFRFAQVDNVIMRYIRFRGTLYSRDTLWFWGNTNVIFDHCTFSHGDDEGGSWADSSGTMTNITIQNCFFQDGKTGTIVGVDGQPGDFTLVNNVWSSISHRFPNPKHDGRTDIINNVIYNWKYRLVNVSGQGEHNVINNYYKGSAAGIHRPGWFVNYDVTPRYMHKVQTNASYMPSIYTSGSVIYNQRTAQVDDSDMWTVFAGSHLPEHSAVPPEYFTDTPFPLVGESYSIKTAEQAYIDVLADVGANKTLNADGSIYPYQDTKDAGDVLMIQNDTYSGDFYDDWFLTVPYPVVPENTRPGNYYSSNPHIPEAWFTANVPNGEDHNDLAPSGYTWLEEYLNTVDGTFQVINKPIITLNGASTVEVNINTSYDELGATASDIEDGDLSSSIVVTGSVDINTEGTYILSYNVQDSDGNDADTVTRTVIVNNPEVNITYNLTEQQKRFSKSSLILLKKINL